MLPKFNSNFKSNFAELEHWKPYQWNDFSKPLEIVQQNMEQFQTRFQIKENRKEAETNRVSKDPTGSLIIHRKLQSNLPLVHEYVQKNAQHSAENDESLEGSRTPSEDENISELSSPSKKAESKILRASYRRSSVTDIYLMKSQEGEKGLFHTFNQIANNSQAANHSRKSESFLHQESLLQKNENDESSSDVESIESEISSKSNVLIPISSKNLQQSSGRRFSDNMKLESQSDGLFTQKKCIPVNVNDDLPAISEELLNNILAEQDHQENLSLVIKLKSAPVVQKDLSLDEWADQICYGDEGTELQDWFADYQSALQKEKEKEKAQAKEKTQQKELAALWEDDAMDEDDGLNTPKNWGFWNQFETFSEKGS